MEKFFIVTIFLIVFGLLWFALNAIFGWVGLIIYALILVLFWQFVKNYKN